MTEYSEEETHLPNGTDCVHAGINRERPHHALAQPIVQTATYTFKNTADLVQYMRGEDNDELREEYGRYGNPTVHELEERVAQLEGAGEGVAFSSGMAAVTSAMLALLKSGDHVVLFSDCYRRTRQFVMTTLARFGVEHTLVPAGNIDAYRAALRPETKLVVTELPTNPYLFCCDLEQVVAIAKQHCRAKVMVDSTFATPINLRPLALGADIVVHSATKYLGGHNDALGGIIVAPNHIASLVRDTRHVLGAVLDPHAAFLLGRGLKTLSLRVKQQNQNAIAIAQYLESHPAVERVFYPLLESHPSYAVASKLLPNGAGGVLSYILKGGSSAAGKFIDALRIPQIGASLGGVESLIEQPRLMSYFELTPEQLEAVGISEGLIRMSVGIEDTCDLLDDLAQALATLD